MDRQQIIDELKQYFKTHELVGPNVYHKYNGDDRCFSVFRTDILHCLLIIRKELGKKITVNNWYWGGIFDERGFRDNLQPIAEERTLDRRLYLSGHVLGAAFDFHVEGMSSERVREWCKDNFRLFPCKIRLEHKLNGNIISWVHIDTKWFEDTPKVYLFSV